MRLFRLKRRWFLLSLCVISVIVACQAVPGRRTQQTTQHNAIIFVADGLRPTSINPKDTPALNEIRERGVKFSHSHSLFPTFTTANASAIATGHYLGDTGDFSNTIKVNA